ncbi:hypothetical protein I4I70_01590 [Enterobacter hormaechei]|uniref:hypothetical protein n=1 Tax=Klebsiella pneumoniae TaxID=573 RepID=UPI001887629B|nr:hypothetical protein [Enterobacter hormaechei]MBF1958493.1 hypothetical protein [Klebsiella pneumoniae]MBF9267804.1 hypothetical protein [Enterobacter hormaechei]
MSKSLKELYAVPEWMRQFLPSFNNTGGNDVEELLHDDCTSMFANSVRYTFIVSARSQFALLMDMYSKGIITGRTGAAKCSDNGVPRKPAVGTELFAAPPAPIVTVRELTMWVKRLAHSLRNAKSGSKLPDDAMAYLSAKGLIGVEDALR